MELFKLHGSVLVDTSDANKNLESTEKKAGSFGETLGKIGKTAAGVATGVATGAVAAATAMYNLAESSASSLDEIQKGAQELGISYQSYQELSYACERSGTSIDVLSKGVKNITNDLADAANGVSGASANFDALGVSLQNADGSFKSTEDVMMESLEALADMDDETQRNALANDIFGKSYQDLAPLLNSGSEGIKELCQNAEDLGIVMDDETVESGATFQDMLTDVQSSLEAIVTKLGASLMPTIESVFDIIMDMMPTIQQVFEEVGPVLVDLLDTLVPLLLDLVQTILPILLDLIDLIVPIFKDLCTQIFPIIVQLIETLLPPIMQIVEMLLPVLLDILTPILSLLSPIITLLSPILEIIVALLTPLIDLINLIIPPLINLISKAVTALSQWLTPILQKVATWLGDKMTGAISKVVEWAKKAWTNIKATLSSAKSGFESFGNAIKNVFNNIWTGIKKVINWVLGGIENMVNGAVKGINVLIKGLDKIVGAVGSAIGLDVNIPTLSEVSLPRLAKGGHISQDGSAIVGEDGAELINMPTGATVTPLQQGDELLHSSEILEAVQNILALVQSGDTFQAAVSNAISGQKIDVNGRELGRLVKKYA